MQNFFPNHGVNITVLKTLWKMLKTFVESRKTVGDRPLWKKLRKNIFGQKGRNKGNFSLKGEKRAGALASFDLVVV